MGNPFHPAFPAKLRLVEATVIDRRGAVIAKLECPANLTDREIRNMVVSLTDNQNVFDQGTTIIRSKW